MEFSLDKRAFYQYLQLRHAFLNQNDTLSFSIIDTPLFEFLNHRIQKGLISETHVQKHFCLNIQPLVDKNRSKS